MRVLTLSYLYYFSRYIDAIIKDLEDNRKKDIIATHVCFYPSAYQYYKKNNIVAIPLYKNKIKSKLINQDIYKDFDLNKIINFHRTLLGDSNKLIIQLKKEAIYLIDFYEDLFKKNNFDLVLSFTENRMQVEIPIEFAKRSNIKIFYIEQGPFKTMTLDEKGVLANLSFSTKELDPNINKSKLDLFFKNLKNRNTDKYNIELTFVDKILNSLDNLFFSPPNILKNKFPLYLRDNTLFNDKLKSFICKRFKLNKRKIEEILPNKYISFILQVPADAQMISHSPLYQSFYNMLTDIYIAKPKDYKLVVREHPVYKGMYEKALYKFIETHSDILLINDVPLEEFLIRSELIILNNSTVGLDALVYYKKIITLGNTYYNRDNIVFHLNKKKDLKELIMMAIKSKVKNEAIDIFLFNLIFNFLIHNHLIDYKYSNMEQVSAKILNNNSYD